MKALTLHQPWASLVAIGVKTIETRSWPTSYRGPLAIHAAARSPKPVRVGDYLVRGFGRTGWALEGPGLPAFRSVPRLEGYIIPEGKVVAIAELVDVVPTGEPEPDAGAVVFYGNTRALTGSPWVQMRSDLEDEPDYVEVDAIERPYGDFTPGRYAWLLSNIQPLDEPIPARGRQRLWEWDEGTVQSSEQGEGA